MGIQVPENCATLMDKFDQFIDFVSFRFRATFKNDHRFELICFFDSSFYLPNANNIFLEKLFRAIYLLTILTSRHATVPNFYIRS